ncbi:SDR family NAD(P)-dependent oxidoreductase [Paracoccus sp. PAMC 22219]|uniref:SDR family NAD(P)-dependent oxidoreductase n=1 Tax=Paracoccus sp. PAMC 22219 TaxID=1569209 RepID=UPI000A910F20|nr:SDR family NAD(P)-dependent oxidoreductase [Paracoccus sp. PAMC 22219]
MQLTLAGQVFAVTGAAQGIGAAIVRTLTGSGATVAAMDIDDAGLTPLAGCRASAVTQVISGGRRAPARFVKRFWTGTVGSTG